MAVIRKTVPNNLEEYRKKNAGKFVSRDKAHFSIYAGDKKIGTVGYDAYKAIESNTLDSYKPKDDNEKSILEKYRLHTSAEVKRNDGTSLGFITQEGLKAIRENKVDKYTPINDAEKQAINSYIEYATKERQERLDNYKASAETEIPKIKEEKSKVTNEAWELRGEKARANRTGKSGTKWETKDTRTVREKREGKPLTKSEGQKEIDVLERKADRLEKKEDALVDTISNIDKYANVVYKDTGWIGQAKANYTQGRLSQDTAEAYNDYINSPTKENKMRADALSALSEQFNINNKNALTTDDEDVGKVRETVRDWVAVSFANYLPQLIDQTKASVEGALAGGATGAIVGSAVPGIGTATGAVWGIRTGWVTGASKQMYDTTRGMIFKSLIDAGYDEETALDAAKDEAFVSSIIEGAGEIVSMATLGTGKLIGKIAPKAATKVSSNVIVNGVKGFAKKTGKTISENVFLRTTTAVAGVFANAAGEYAEEYSQEAVSIANERRLKNNSSNSLVSETLSLLSNPDSEASERLHAAGSEGFKIGLMMGGATKIATNTGASASGHISNAIAGRNIKKADANESGVIQSVIDVGLKQPENTQAYKLATKLNSNDKISNAQLGKLAKSNKGETVNVGETYYDTKSNGFLNIVSRDDTTTTITMVNSDGIGVAKEFANENVDNLTKNNRYVLVHNESETIVEPSTETNAEQTTTTDEPSSTVAENATVENEVVEDTIITNVRNALTSGKLTSKQIDDIISNPSSRDAFAQLTGVEIKGTKAEQRAIIRNWANDSSNVENLKRNNASLNAEATTGEAYPVAESTDATPVASEEQQLANFENMLVAKSVNEESRQKIMTNASRILPALSLKGKTLQDFYNGVSFVTTDSTGTAENSTDEQRRKAYWNAVANAFGNQSNMTSDEQADMYLAKADGKVSVVVDAMNETLLPGAKEAIFESMENKSLKGDITVFAKELREVYEQNGTIGAMADYFSDNGREVIFAIERTMDTTAIKDAKKTAKETTQKKASTKTKATESEDSSVDATTTTTKSTTIPQSKIPSVKVGDVYEAGGNTYTITGRENGRTSYTVTDKNGNTTQRETSNVVADINFTKEDSYTKKAPAEKSSSTQKKESKSESKTKEKKVVLKNATTTEIDGVEIQDNTIKWDSLNERQKQAITFIKGLAKASGMKLVLVKNLQGGSGAFSIGENIIYLNVYAGINPLSNKDIIITTMSHELTHWMEQKAPELYHKISDLVFSTLQKADGLSKADRIKAVKKELLDKKVLKDSQSESLKNKIVQSEIVARACEDMLAMSEQGKKIFNSLSESEQKELVAKIKEIIQDILDWVSEFLSSYESNRPEAKKMRQYEAELKELSKLWDEMLVESIKANQSGAFERNAKLGETLYSAAEILYKSNDEVDLLLSEEDYPIDDEVEKTVQHAVSNSKSKMHTLSIITPQQNKAINRLALKENNDFFRGKFTGGKHLVSDYAIKHAVAEHGDFLREALRAQLPITPEDIARHLSAVKNDKTPSDVKASRTRQGNASIITSYEVNGYTLYAEEITKSLGQNAPSDLIGHTMYKAPTLSTAAAPATSAGALPKRQSMVLCEYYTTNGNALSSGEFVADVNGKPAKLYFILQNNIPKADTLLGGLIALSSNSDNFTDKSASIGYGYVVCKKPYHITQDNRVFSNSETNVAESINDLKKQGYDCFIFDKVTGDNYMVAVVNKAQIVENEPDILYSEKNFSIDDYNERDFSYAELVAKDDLEGTVIRENQQVKLMADGSIDADWVVSEVKNKCQSIQTKAPMPTYYTHVPDIGKNVEISRDGVRHGFIKHRTDGGKKVSPNALINARVSLELPQILSKSIEVNRSKRGNNIDVPYSHIMMGTVALEDSSGNLEYYAVRSVIEERLNQNPILIDAKVFGKLYAVNAKKIGTPQAQVAKNGVALTSSVAYTYNVAQFLSDVKTEFDDTFSTDVYAKLGLQRQNGDFSNYLFYSESERWATEEDESNNAKPKKVKAKKKATSLANKAIDAANKIPGINILNIEGESVSIDDIINMIKENFDIPISTGKVMDSRAAGVYKPKAEAIRTRIANNLPTISHELGHHLDKLYVLNKLDSVKELRQALPKEFLDQYPESQRNGEAVAEFVRIYLRNTNEAKALCDDFYIDFIKALSKDDLKAVDVIANVSNQYMSSSFSERVQASIVRGDFKEKTTLSEKAKKMHSDWIDGYTSIKDVTDYVEEKLGVSLTGRRNAYTLATNSLNAASIANFNTMHGFRNLNGNIVSGAKSYIECIADVNKKDLNILDEYLVLKHSLEWIAEQKRVFGDDTLEDDKSINTRIAEIEDEHPEMKQAAENLYEYQRNLLKYFVIPAGGMTTGTYNSLIEKYPCYVPFYRAVGKDSAKTKSSFANQKSPIKRAKGSGESIISPLESIIRNTDKFAKFALRNQTMQVLANYANTVDGFGKFIERVPPDMLPHNTDISRLKAKFEDALQQVINSSDDYFAVSDLFGEIFGESVTDYTPVANANKKIVTVLNNGEFQYYQVHDDALYDAIAELSPKNLEGIFKISHMLMQPMKLLITQNNPVFALTNALRDIGAAYKHSPITNPIEFAKAYALATKAVITNSDITKQWRAMGGGHNAELSANLDQIKIALRQVAQKDMGKARRLLYSLVFHPIETVASINDYVESIPRVMEFTRTLETGGDLQEAIYNADDITTNFKRGGKGALAKNVNALVMFNNAALQGLDKARRTLTNKDKTARTKTLLKWALSALLIAAIQSIWNKGNDDEGYENLSSYKKNNFYNFSIGDGKFISLPKARELALLDSFTERTIEYVFGNDEAFYDFGGYVAQQLLPPMLPETLNPVGALHDVLGSTVWGGITDVGWNENFMNVPIEGKYDEYLPSNERYNESTSKLAYDLGQTKLARALDMSPKKIDHLISSYTGIIGQANKALNPMSKERRDVTIGLRNKFISDSNYSTDLLNKMYDNKDKAELEWQYDNNITNAVEYERNSAITSFISGMNKAIKALPGDEQREGRQYLLKALNNWDYDLTTQQSKMQSNLKDESISKDYIFDGLPSSKLEWTKDKQKYTYQMTPQEYNKYISDYLKVIEAARKQFGGNSLESYAKAKDAVKDYMSKYKKGLTAKYQPKASKVK